VRDRRGLHDVDALLRRVLFVPSRHEPPAGAGRSHAMRAGALPAARLSQRRMCTVPAAASDLRGGPMRRTLISLALAVSGCAAASAQPAEQNHCETVHDCVTFTYPCDCCHCPAVTSRTRLRALEHVWATDDCETCTDAGQCTTPCPAVRPACVGHVCVAR
jgi:hypothetical protein